MLRLRQALESGNCDITYSDEYYRENKETIDRYKIEGGEVSYDLPQEILIDIKLNNILGKKENRNYMKIYEKHIKCETNSIEKGLFSFFFGYNGNILIVSFVLIIMIGLIAVIKILKNK